MKFKLFLIQLYRLISPHTASYSLKESQAVSNGMKRLRLIILIYFKVLIKKYIKWYTSFCQLFNTKLSLGLGLGS